MNICFLHRWFPPNGGGIGGIVPYLETISQGLARRGHQVFVFTEATADTPMGLSLEGNLTVYRMPRPPVGSDVPGQLAHLWAIARRLERFVQMHEIDVVETCDWGAETLFLRAERVPSLRVVLKLHCPIAVADWARQRRPRLRGHLYSWMERRVMLQADRVISPSVLCADLTQRLLRLPNVPMDIVPNPIDTDYWKPAPVSAQPPCLLFAGRLEQMKGASRLAEFLDPLLYQNPDLTIRFVGSDSHQAPGGGSVIDYLRRHVHPRRMERLQCVGAKTRTQMRAEYQRATLCWLPSLFESFSLTCGEAMACGVPVIGSQTTAMREIIQDGRSGFVVDFDDAAQVMDTISQLLHERALRDHVATEARKRIQDYCAVEQVAPWYETFFAQNCAGISLEETALRQAEAV